MSESKEAWLLWTQNPCFTHLLDMIEEIKKQSVNDEDSISTADLSIQIVSESRGVRKGLNTLLRNIQDNVPNSK